jgi:sulfofructose kinase
MTIDIDVLCVGHASYDLVFTVDHHLAADEKAFASDFLPCGGGPAANAAVTVARLGLRAAFAGYLGNDPWGQAHLEELRREGVDVSHVVTGDAPTPLSVVLVKPDGSRALVNYKGNTGPLDEGAVDFRDVRPAVILFDGHEPRLSPPLAQWARRQGIATVLDAGSVHAGTLALMDLVDHLVASEKFATQWLKRNDPQQALAELARHAPAVVVTLGEHGLIWRKGEEHGALPAFPVTSVDTTGAGDVFHGAYAAALAAGFAWLDLLRFASAAGALSCIALGARPSIPRLAEAERLLKAASA